MRKRTGYIENLAALLLLAVFGVCVLMVLFIGADAYGRLTQRDEAAYNSRTAIQYIAARVRQGDRMDSIAVEDFDGTQALVLDKDSEYVTRLYCYDGALRELYADAGLPLSPADGQEVLKAQQLRLRLADGLLRLELTDASGQVDTLVLSLRSGKGMEP